MIDFLKVMLALLVTGVVLMAISLMAGLLFDSKGGEILREKLSRRFVQLIGEPIECSPSELAPYLNQVNSVRQEISNCKAELYQCRTKK